MCVLFLSFACAMRPSENDTPEKADDLSTKCRAARHALSAGAGLLDLAMPETGGTVRRRLYDEILSGTSQRQFKPSFDCNPSAPLIIGDCDCCYRCGAYGRHLPLSALINCAIRAPGIKSILEKNKLFVTAFLQNPIIRVVAEYRRSAGLLPLSGNVQDSPAIAHGLKKNVSSLESFVTSEDCLANNRQTWMLAWDQELSATVMQGNYLTRRELRRFAFNGGLDFWDRYCGENGEVASCLDESTDLLDAALGHLRKTTFFGLADQLSRSQELFHWTFKNTFFDKTSLVRATEKLQKKISLIEASITSEERQMVEAYNHLDMLLYDKAKKIFEKRYALMKRCQAAEATMAVEDKKRPYQNGTAPRDLPIGPKFDMSNITVSALQDVDDRRCRLMPPPPRVLPPKSSNNKYCREHIKTRTGLGFEMIEVVPYAYSLYTKGLLCSTESAYGSKALYFFSPQHKELNKDRSITWEQENIPTIKHHHTNFSEWLAPPYKQHYCNEEFVYNRPILFIGNKYSVEWAGHAPINTLNEAVLRRLFELLAVHYQIIYWRPYDFEFSDPASFFLHDWRADFDLIEEWNEAFPSASVLTIQSLLAQHSTFNLNEILFRVLANTDRFINVKGGNAVMTNFFSGVQLLYVERSALTREEAKEEFPYYTHSEIHVVKTYERLLEKAKMLFAPTATLPPPIFAADLPLAKRFLYLAFVEAEPSPALLEIDAREDADLLVLSSEYRSHRTDVYLSQASWSSGRNALYRAAQEIERRRGFPYDYHIYTDDVTLKAKESRDPFRWWHKFLLKHKPPIGVVRSIDEEVNDSVERVSRVLRFSKQFIAIRVDAREKLLPYSGKFENTDTRLPHAIFSHEAELLYPQQVLQLEHIQAKSVSSGGVASARKTQEPDWELAAQYVLGEMEERGLQCTLYPFKSNRTWPFDANNTAAPCQPNKEGVAFD